MRATLDDVARDTGLPPPRTPAAAAELCWLLEQTQLVLDQYEEQLFAADTATLAQQTSRGRSGAMPAMLAYMTGADYRAALQRAIALRRTPLSAFGGGSTIARELEHAAYIGELWQRVAPGISPRAWGRLDTLRAQLAEMRAILERLRPFGVVDDAQPLETMAGRCAALQSDSRAAFRVARMNEILRELRSWNLGPLLDGLKRTATPAELWPRCFEFAWLSSILDQLFSQDTGLASFSGQAQSQVVREFGASDRQRLEIAAARVRRAHAEAVIAAMNQYPDEADLVRREAAKKKRHLPLRTLLARAPHVLTAVCPCWMASPLSVSQLVDARQAHFDVVVFDEASQVPPEDAVAAILRGRQLVVAGDRHQLPPTRFFIAGDDDDVEAGELAPAEGFESLLDLLGAQLDFMVARLALSQPRRVADRVLEPAYL